MQEGICKKYDIRIRGVLGPKAIQEEVTEVSVLNRVVRWGK